MNYQTFNLYLNDDINNIILDLFTFGFSNLIPHARELKNFLSKEVLDFLFDSCQNDNISTNIINFKVKYKDLLR